MDRYESAPDGARNTVAQDEFGMVPVLDRPAEEAREGARDSGAEARDERRDTRQNDRDAARARPAGEGDRRQAGQGTGNQGTDEARSHEAERPSGDAPVKQRQDRDRPAREKPEARPGKAEPATTAARPSRRRLWLGLLLLVALAAAGYGGWRYWQGKQAGQQAGGQGSGQQAGQGEGKGGQDGGQGGGKGVAVTVTQAKAMDVPVYLYGLGTVEAENTVTVRTQVDGQVLKVAYKEGQDVKQGDLLVQIDPRPFQATLDQATAKLAADQSSLKDATLNLQRYSQLAQQQFASRQQLDTQYATVNTLQATLKGDQAQIDAARTQLGFATIRSPISGRTGFRLVDEGNVVHSADTTGLVTIQQLKPIAVVFTAPEDQVQAIRAARRAGTVNAWALSSDGSRTLDRGALELINNEVDQTSGTIRLKASFPNAQDQLWPGLSVSTRLQVSTIKGGLTVPDDAIQHGQDGLFVYTVGEDGKDKGKAVLTQVEVSHSDNGVSVVTKGLKEGQAVVVEGQYKVQPGVKLDTKPLDQKGKPAGDGATGAQASNQAGQADGQKGGQPADPQAQGGAGARGGKAQPGDGQQGGRDASHQTSPVTVRQE